MKFFTAQQIAESVQVTPARVYEAIRLGLLPAVHIGRQVRVEEQAFHDWVRNGGRRNDKAVHKQAS